MKEPTTRDIIEALGGVNHIRDKICVERAIIDNWMRPDRRIGAAYWIDILALARRQRVTWITAETLRKARGEYARKNNESV